MAETKEIMRVAYKSHESFPKEFKPKRKGICLYHVFIAKDIKDVVFNILTSGYNVSFGPFKDEMFDKKELIFGQVKKKEKLVALLHDTVLLPKFFYKDYKRAKTVVTLFSSEEHLIGLLKKWYKKSLKISECQLREQKAKKK
jgi:hypothetical protein